MTEHEADQPSAAQAAAPAPSPQPYGVDPQQLPPNPNLAEFERVCDTLARLDEDIGDPEWCDGYLTAVAAGPRAIDIDEWLEPLAGDTFARAFADPHDDARARAALLVRYAELRRQLDPEALLDDPDSLRLAPLMVEWDEEGREQARAEGVPEESLLMLQTGAAWAAGFMDGVQAFMEDWTPPQDEAVQNDFAQALESVGALLLDPAGEDYRAFVETGWSKEHPPTRDDLIDEAMLAVQDLRILWVEHAPKPATRRVGEQPGRNDPCTCGSGKKWKKCCGASA